MADADDGLQIVGHAVGSSHLLQRLGSLGIVLVHNLCQGSTVRVDALESLLGQCVVALSQMQVTLRLSHVLGTGSPGYQRLGRLGVATLQGQQP